MPGMGQLTGKNFFLINFNDLGEKNVLPPNAGMFYLMGLPNRNAVFHA